jgi:hypothetical protein
MDSTDSGYGQKASFCEASVPEESGNQVNSYQYFKEKPGENSEKDMTVEGQRLTAPIVISKELSLS